MGLSAATRLITTLIGVQHRLTSTESDILRASLTPDVHTDAEQVGWSSIYFVGKKSKKTRH